MREEGTREKIIRKGNIERDQNRKNNDRNGEA